MNDAKYIGLEFTMQRSSEVVWDPPGKVVPKFIVETKAASILQLIYGLRRTCT